MPVLVLNKMGHDVWLVCQMRQHNFNMTPLSFILAKVVQYIDLLLKSDLLAEGGYLCKQHHPGRLLVSLHIPKHTQTGNQLYMLKYTMEI